MSVIQNIRFLAAFGKFTKEVGKENRPMKWLAPLGALAVAAFGIYTPAITDFVAHHANYATAIGVIGTLLASIAPQPHK